MSYENNKNQKKSVNTKGQAYYNGKQTIPCAMSVAYWDDMVKLSFAKELPQEQQTMNRRYDHDNAVITAISRIKVEVLYEQYKEIIVPALKEARDESISVTVGQVNQVQIATNVDENNVPHPTLRLIKDIGEDLKASTNNILEYEFNTTEVVYGYDPKNGTFTRREFIFAELDLFMRDLNSALEASSNAYVHTDRVVKRYMNDRTDSKLNQIGTKLGLDLDYKPQYSSGNGGQGSIFDNKPNTQSAGGYEVPTNSVGSIEELNSVIG